MGIPINHWRVPDLGSQPRHPRTSKDIKSTGRTLMLPKIQQNDALHRLRLNYYIWMSFFISL